LHIYTAGVVAVLVQAKVFFHAWQANDWTMSVSVGIITAQMLQDAHLTDIGG